MNIRFVTQCGGELGEDMPAAADVPGAGGGGTDPLETAFGVGDRAVLLGVRFEREDHIRELGGVGRGHREVDHEVGGFEGLAPALGVGEVAERVDSVKDDCANLARDQARLDFLDVTTGFGFREAGARVRKAADLAQTAGVGDIGNLDQARFLLTTEVEDAGQLEQRLDRSRAVFTAPDPLTPDHDRVGGVLEQAGDAVGGTGLDLVEQVREVPGRIARLDALDFGGAAVEGGRPLGGDRQRGAVATDRLANPQVKGRSRVDRVVAQYQHHIGVVDVNDPGLGGRVIEADPLVAADRGSRP